MKVLFALLAFTAQAVMAAPAVDPLQNKTIQCTVVGAPTYVRSPFALTITKNIGYHRDGRWYETQFDHSSITTYALVTDLHSLSSGYAAGLSYNAMIYRDGIKLVHLSDVRGSSNQVTWPTGFRGKVILFNDQVFPVNCSYQ